MAVDFAGDVKLQATNNLAFALSVFCAFIDIGKRWFVASHSDDGHTIENGVGLSIAASVRGGRGISDQLLRWIA